MVALFVISVPLGNFADSKNKKENEGRKNEVKVSVSASSTTSSNFGQKLKAFGHFIAPGWIKNNGERENEDEDNLPKGIVKVLNKERGEKDERKNDDNKSVNLKIKDLSVKVRADSANVVWKTNQKAHSALLALDDYTGQYRNNT